MQSRELVPEAPTPSEPSRNPMGTFPALQDLAMWWAWLPLHFQPALWEASQSQGAVSAPLGVGRAGLPLGQIRRAQHSPPDVRCGLAGQVPGWGGAGVGEGTGTPELGCPELGGPVA